MDQLGLAENVHFLGYVPEAHMPGLYRRARALVMPTFFGPTNIPPWEAIALGCPVAVSDIDGMRDQMGDAALFFDPTSVPEMAQVMERLWRDDALCRELANVAWSGRRNGPSCISMRACKIFLTPCC